jgi:TM2 domain-containing membrane protein YozV
VREEKGILFSSGLVAGDALVGVLIAFLIGIPGLNRIYENLPVGAWLGNFADIGSIIIFLIIAAILLFQTRK